MNEVLKDKSGNILNPRIPRYENPKIPRYEKVYDNILDKDLSSIEIDCDILKDGGKYILEIVGRLTSKADIYLRLNDVTKGYWQSAFGYNFSGTTSDGTGTAFSGYRPDKNGFYYGVNFNGGQDIMMSKVTYEIEMLKENSCPYVNWKLIKTFNGDSEILIGGGQQSNSFENITKITIYTISSFTKGTRITLKRG